MLRNAKHFIYVTVRSHLKKRTTTMVQIFKTDKEKISRLRIEYIESLSEFQELHLELLVEESAYFIINASECPIGYFIKTKDNILVEFYLINEYIPQSHDIFIKIVREYAITSTYSKTFDALLLDCCLLHYTKYKIIGVLFRDFFETDIYPLDGLSVRTATELDYSFLLQQEDGLYESPEELTRFVNGGNISMFIKENELYGCGYLIKVHENWDYYDIGMWVNPNSRNQGVATRIISYLKELCLKNVWIPICACAYGNVASQKTLEKNGFVSKYKLVEFGIDGNILT